MGCNKIFHLLSVKYFEIQITKRILPSSLRVCYTYLGEVTDAFNVICKEKKVEEEDVAPGCHHQIVDNCSSPPPHVASMSDLSIDSSSYACRINTIARKTCNFTKTALGASSTDSFLIFRCTSPDI